jgi:hypothetical protein
MGRGRPENPVKPITIHIAINPVMHAYLVQLVRRGLYGNGPNDAARKLIEQGIADLIEAKKLKEAPDETPSPTDAAS